MNPVEYTINLQRLLLLSCGFSFVGLSTLLVFVDPYENNIYIWAFLGVLTVFLTSIISLFTFWWYFTIRKQILPIYQVNQLVYQSMVTAGITVLLLVMQQTQVLTIWRGILVLICYILYELWINSE
ncbi:MAG: hypothetical protein AAGF07_01345 [Patescibacteria group bacterium]